MRSLVSTSAVLFVLRTFATLLVSAILPGAAHAAEKPALTIEAICDGELSLPAPSQMRWLPDGRLSYLVETEGEGTDDDKEKGRDLWVLDVASGEAEIVVPDAELQRMAPSPDQAGVDERERTRRTRFQVSAYAWSPDATKLLFTSTGQIWLYTLEGSKAELRAPSKKGVLDPKFSPDGASISFVVEHDLWVVPVEGGPARQLTTGGHELLLHGDLDWVYPEELDVRTGYHWSPDSRHIALLEMDESPVPTYPIPELLGARPSVDLQRYPRAGDPSPRVRVGIVHVESTRLAWLDRHAEYIPRIDWADADTVAVQLLNRGQDELEMVFANPSTGRSRSIFFETDPHWIDVTNDLTFLDDGKHFLWTSARTGMRHVYLMNREAAVVRRLSEGEYRVGALAGVDAENGWVYYTANAENVLGNDLYRVSLDGTGRERLTDGKGTHRVDMNPAATAYTDSYSSLDVAELGRRSVVDLETGQTTEIYRERDVAAEFDIVQPELLELEAKDGALIRMMMIRPKKLARGKKHPVVVYVYGMAGVPTIRDSLSLTSKRNLFHQFLVQKGFIVVHVDDRSSAIPGHRYAALADLNIGPVAANDHRAAVEHLRTLPYVDAENIAVWGWSGGGFSASFHMARTDLFKVGVAGAPVTDWRLYDSIYTERYMGTPQDNLEAYDRTSALLGVSDTSRRMLLIHGTHDDNVHPQNTIQMIDALIRSRVQFELMMYPNKTHGIRGDDHTVHMYTMIHEFFDRHLR